MVSYWYMMIPPMIDFEIVVGIVHSANSYGDVV